MSTKTPKQTTKKRKQPKVASVVPVRSGVHQDHGNRILSLDAQFKEMRLQQIESQVVEYIAYFHKHGHFKKVHPITGEVLRDTNGMPLSIPIPSLMRELQQLKETMIFSESLDSLVGQLKDVIEVKSKPDKKSISHYNLPSVTTFNSLFKKF